MSPAGVVSVLVQALQEVCIRFSIVTNAFNQGAFLPEALTSVLTQAGVEVEYFVVDPGSSDNTRQVLHQFMERYPDRIHVITEPDHGPADGLNRAFQRATGDIFGYLNADDFYLPGALLRVARALDRHPYAHAIYADGYIADLQGRLVKRVVSTSFTPKRFVFGGALVLQQSTFYRASAFREVGGFNADNRSSWDAELLLEMAMRGMRLAHIPEYWSVFRIHPESITGSQRSAADSRATHARYFRRVMGREKRSSDALRTTATRLYSLLAQPRVWWSKLLNSLFPPVRPHIPSAD